MENSITLFKNIPVDGSPYKDKIDLKKFGKTLPELSAYFKQELEQDLLKYGRQESFYVKESDSVPDLYELLWGHFEYNFILQNDLPFTIIKMEFPSDDEALKHIIRKNLLQQYMSAFQRGVIVLNNKALLLPKGKLNMIKGGQGIQVPETEKTNTMKTLAKWARCSATTLYDIECILRNLKDDKIYQQLENEELTISRVAKELSDVSKAKDRFPFKRNNGETQNAQISHAGTIVEYNDTTTKSKLFINELDKYSVGYVKLNWPLKRSVDSEDFFEDLKKMNIWDITLKFSTFLIQTPTMFLSETIDLIKQWGFTIQDTLVVSLVFPKYQSVYAEHYNDLIIICHRNNVGVPVSCIKNKPYYPIIQSENVFDVIDSMFDPNLERVGIFTKIRQGWDTYDYDPEAKEMIKYFTNAS